MDRIGTAGPDPRWSCHRKRRHDTERQAAGAIARMREQGVDVEQLHAYACLNGCGGWHVGHAIGARSAGRGQ